MGETAAQKMLALDREAEALTKELAALLKKAHHGDTSVVDKLQAEAAEKAAAAAVRRKKEKAAIAAAALKKEQRQDEAELKKAAEAYNAEYQARMAKSAEEKNFKAMQAAKPFIGFGLTEMPDHLVVDSFYPGGPANQVGVDLNDTIIALGTSHPQTLDEFREAMAAQCACGKITTMTLRNVDGSIQEANLWVMTSDTKHAGKAYFFDTASVEKVLRPKKSPRRSSVRKHH